MATIEERLAALEALLGLSEGEAPYVSKYSGPEIDEGIELARSGTVRNTGGTMKKGCGGPARSAIPSSVF